MIVKKGWNLFSWRVIFRW